MPGSWWRRAGALSFPLGLVFGRGNPYSFIIFFSQMRCLLLLGRVFCFVFFFEKNTLQYSYPLTHISPGRNSNQEGGQTGERKGLGWAPLAWVLETARSHTAVLLVSQDMAPGLSFFHHDP